MYLRDIATLFYGTYQRRETSGNALYLQLNGVDASRQFAPRIQYDSLDRIPTPHDPKLLLTPNDILVVAKGAQNYALHFPEFTAPVVASSTFLVVRVTSKGYRPSFLCWYLNSLALKTLGGMHSGTMRVLSKPEVEKIHVPEISWREQAQIIEMLDLMSREEELSQILVEKKRRFLVNFFKCEYL